jgi:dTDP-4-amino-4,6-dideoxygalactose transaminase
LDPEKLRHYLQTQCELDSKTGRYKNRKLGQPVTAVVPVHLYGQSADMDAILEIAARYNLVVVEDACQAHGTEYFSKAENRWRKCGSMGQAAAFSFYPGKNLGACGEGGAITTNDEAVARKCKMIRDHGQSKKYYHDMEGYNGRLDSIQAGLLHVKLNHLEKWNEQRRMHASEYNRLLASDDAILCPYEPNWSQAVYHLYVIRISNRDGLMHFLSEKGIGTGIHYPIPLHLQKAYESMNYGTGDFPVAERVASEIVSLPLFPQLSAAQQQRVADEVLTFSRNRSSDGYEAEQALVAPLTGNK